MTMCYPGTASHAPIIVAFGPRAGSRRARAKLDRVRPIAERHALTPLQLACAWNLAHEAVECVVPTLIQEPGEHAKPIERKREELAGGAELPRC